MPNPRYNRRLIASRACCHPAFTARGRQDCAHSSRHPWHLCSPSTCAWLAEMSLSTRATGRSRATPEVCAVARVNSGCAECKNIGLHSGPSQSRGNRRSDSLTTRQIAASVVARRCGLTNMTGPTELDELRERAREGHILIFLRHCQRPMHAISPAPRVARHESSRLAPHGCLDVDRLVRAN